MDKQISSSTPNAMHIRGIKINIKDLDTNDINVNNKLKEIFANKTLEWNLIIAHYLGIDHCGHSFGSKSHVIKRKLKDIDDTIKLIFLFVEILN